MSTDQEHIILSTLTGGLWLFADEVSTRLRRLQDVEPVSPQDIATLLLRLSRQSPPLITAEKRHTFTVFQYRLTDQGRMLVKARAPEGMVL